MKKATIHNKFTPNWCLIVVIGYSMNKINFYVHFDHISNTPHKKTQHIACSSVTNRARKDFKNQNDPGKKLTQVGLVAKSVSIIGFLKNRVMRIGFLCIINVQFNIFISVFLYYKAIGR